MRSLDRTGLRRIRLSTEGTFLAVDSVEADELAAALRLHAENADPARCLKIAPGRRVTRVPIRLGIRREAPGRAHEVEAVVKEQHLPWRWRLVHALGWPSRFAREPGIGERLQAEGVSVPRFLAASLRVHRGRAFLVTEYVAGAAPLSRRIWRGPEVIPTTEEILHLLSLVARWLRRLHDRGLWHRDMKPDNILVRTSAEVGPDLLIVDLSDVKFLRDQVDESRRVRNLGQILDLPARFDAVARAPFLNAYLGQVEAKERQRWERLVAVDITARRLERKRVQGITFVDERL